MDIKNTLTLEIHYFLIDENLHTMDARVHNECAKHLIRALMHLNKYLDEPIEVEVFAKNEGGLKDRYKVVIKNPLLVILITALITNAMNQFFSSNFPPAINPSEETSYKLDNLLKIKEAIKTGTLTSEDFEYIAENDKELKKLKSNFFRSAKKEDRINSIEVSAHESNANPIFKPIRINSTEFNDCVLPEEFVSNETEDNAKIYIVSPVLLKGRKDHWKGLYNGESIDFRVSDKVYLDSVYNQSLKFSNGTYINCCLQITRVTSTVDNAEKVSRNVVDVVSFGDDLDFSLLYKKRNRVIKKEDDDPSLFPED